MTRIALTPKMANSLRDARIAKGMSQYQLAEQLGWVRSKIKRLEKHEVLTIPQEAHEKMLRILGTHAPPATPPKTAPQPKAPKASSVKKADPSSLKGVPLLIKIGKGAASPAPFTVLRTVPRRATALRYIKVRFEQPFSLEDLVSARVILATDESQQYSINGVEYRVRQGPVFKPGDVMVLGFFPR
jgi:transcriptional regulator with XRE-family HTH domain